MYRHTSIPSLIWTLQLKSFLTYIMSHIYSFESYGLALNLKLLIRYTYIFLAKTVSKMYKKK